MVVEHKHHKHNENMSLQNVHVPDTSHLHVPDAFEKEDHFVIVLQSLVNLHFPLFVHWLHMIPGYDLQALQI